MTSLCARHCGTDDKCSLFAEQVNGSEDAHECLVKKWPVTCFIRALEASYWPPLTPLFLATLHTSCFSWRTNISSRFYHLPVCKTSELFIYGFYWIIYIYSTSSSIFGSFWHTVFSFIQSANTTVLVSILWTWHKLESFDKRKPQLRKFTYQIGLRASLWGYFLD